MIRKTKSFSLIYVIIVFFLMLMFIIPQTKNIITYDMLAIFSFIFIILFVTTMKEELSSFLRVFMIALPYCLMYFLVARPLNIKYGFFHPLLLLWVSLFPSFVAVNLIDRGGRREMMTLLLLSIISLFIIYYTTFSVLSTNEIAVRALTAGTNEDLVNDLTAQGVGGYGIAYAAGAITVALLTIYRYIYIKWLKLCLLFVIIFFILFVLNAQFATLVIITFIACIYIVFINAKKSIERIGLVLLSLAFIILFPTILSILIDFFGGSVIGDKFTQMYNSLYVSQNTTQISGDRSEMQLAALDLFLQRPLFGNSLNNVKNAVVVGAAHSTILGELATTGLIGIISFVYSFVYCINRIKKSLGTIGHLFNPVVFYLLLFAFFNPIMGARDAMWIILFIIPLMIAVLKPYVNTNIKNESN